MKEEDRVDQDQLYLAERISTAWGKDLTLPALQKLNIMFGRGAVTSALRLMHGFPPVLVRDPYAYLKSMCASSGEVNAQ